jgi:hypothetical protein
LSSTPCTRPLSSSLRRRPPHPSSAASHERAEDS